MTHYAQTHNSAINDGTPSYFVPDLDQWARHIAKLHFAEHELQTGINCYQQYGLWTDDKNIPNPSEYDFSEHDGKWIEADSTVTHYPTTKKYEVTVRMVNDHNPDERVWARFDVSYQQVELAKSLIEPSSSGELVAKSSLIATQQALSQAMQNAEAFSKELAQAVLDACKRANDKSRSLDNINVDSIYHRIMQKMYPADQSASSADN